ncbi:hypothetical protein [Prevotella histicola]|uniref:hypothetical protein n=1 Tax=Prevotella histicola TaxID=470565 RepID=UPI0028EEB5C2|nr:hypothetical protein [Prevotella histicola]
MALKSSRTITKKFANKIKIVREQNSVSTRTIRKDEKKPYPVWAGWHEQERFPVTVCYGTGESGSLHNF